MLQELAIQAAEHQTLIPPALKPYILSDTPVEKLGEILISNSNGVLIFRDEMTGSFGAWKGAGASRTGRSTSKGSTGRVPSPSTASAGGRSAS